MKPTFPLGWHSDGLRAGRSVRLKGAKALSSALFGIVKPSLECWLLLVMQALSSSGQLTRELTTWCSRVLLNKEVSAPSAPLGRPVAASAPTARGGSRRGMLRRGHPTIYLSKRDRERERENVPPQKTSQVFYQTVDRLYLTSSFSRRWLVAILQDLLSLYQRYKDAMPRSCKSQLKCFYCSS